MRSDEWWYAWPFLNIWADVSLHTDACISGMFFKLGCDLLRFCFCLNASLYSIIDILLSNEWFSKLWVLLGNTMVKAYVTWRRCTGIAWHGLYITKCQKSERKVQSLGTWKISLALYQAVPLVCTKTLRSCDYFSRNERLRYQLSMWLWLSCCVMFFQWTDGLRFVVSALFLSSD